MKISLSRLWPIGLYFALNLSNLWNVLRSCKQEKGKNDYGSKRKLVHFPLCSLTWINQNDTTIWAGFVVTYTTKHKEQWNTNNFDLKPDEDNFLSKVLVFHHIGEYISPDLFYFVNLTSSCSLSPWFCGVFSIACVTGSLCMKVQFAEQYIRLH